MSLSTVLTSNSLARWKQARSKGSRPAVGANLGRANVTELFYEWQGRICVHRVLRLRGLMIKQEANSREQEKLGREKKEKGRKNERKNIEKEVKKKNYDYLQISLHYCS
jgi:hypothetical protein